MVKKHNIFEFATSELSNDAILCWIINGLGHLNSSSEFKKVSMNFIKQMLGEIKVNFDEVKVEKQKQLIGANDKKLYIDIFVELRLNGVTIHTILIEDKVDSGESGNQLLEYRSAINNDLNDKSFVFINIGNRSSNYKERIKHKGWSVIDRNNLLNCINCDVNLLNHEEGLLIQYRNYLTDLENEFNNYLKIDVKDWNSYNVQGFFQSLENDKTEYDWGTVYNPSGGFIAIWYMKHTFLFKQQIEFSVYLQLEYPFKNNKDMRVAIKISTNKYDELESENSENPYKYTEDFRKILADIFDVKFFTKSRKTNAKTMTLSYKSILESNENPTISVLRNRISVAENYFNLLIKQVCINSDIILLGAD